MGAQTQPIKPTPQQSPLTAASLAVALYLFLVDAAVETFLSGSPVRWCVAGLVAVYLAASVALWRYRRSTLQSIGWSGRASASFFLLLALLAFTVWLPGGLDDGIRLAGAQTSTVLSLVTAVVIALAGVSLLRRSWSSRWVKWVIGALAAYGVVGFMKGIISGTSYPELFHGQSFWSWLPWWLQGAFVGALIIVPVELIARAWRMLRAAPGAARNWELRQLVAMAMSVLMAVSGATSSGFGGPQPSAAEIVQPVAKSYQELGEALAGPKPKTPLTPDQVADRLDKIFPMLEQAEREIPRDTFDMQAVLDKVGKDPQKLFEWVRDNTYFVPYHGLLRGDKGVLMDRLGSSLDRAMLLFAMLRNIGQPARLAHGALTEAQASDILRKVRPFPTFKARTGSTSSSAATDAFVKQHADENHVDAARIQKALKQLTEQQQRTKELVQKRVAAQAAMIAAAVGPPPKSALAEERANQVRSLTDHWWVEWQNGANWIDFDPTLPDAQSGKTLTAAQGTFIPNSYTDIGEDLLHTVQIQVVIEVWKHGQVTEVPVLTQKLLPADLIGVPIVLRQIPVAWPQDLDLFQEKDPLERLKRTVLAQTEWLPVLSVGSQNISRYSFNDYGDLNDSTLPGYVQNVMAGRVLAHKEEEAVEGLGKTVGGMLGGSGGQGQPPNQKPAATSGRTQVTAEWIEYGIGCPGQPVRKIRREIFDLIGPAARSAKKVSLLEVTDARRLERGLNLLGGTKILPLVSLLSSEFVQDLAVKNVLANRQASLSLLGMPDSSDRKALTGLASKLIQFPGQLYLLALARREWSRFRDDVYLDRPDILSYYNHLGLNAKGEVLVREGYDIVANEVAVHLSRETDPFFIRLEQGLLDTNAEAVLDANRCEFSEEDPSCRRIENTAELFIASRKGGTEWLALRGVRDPAWEQVELPRNVRARVEQDLAAGYTVLVSRKTVRRESDSLASWWRVNLRTGDTLGIGEAGRGQTATEYILTFGPDIAILSLDVYCLFLGGEEKHPTIRCNPCLIFYANFFYVLVWGMMFLALADILEMGYVATLGKVATGIGVVELAGNLLLCIGLGQPPQYRKLPRPWPF